MDNGDSGSGALGDSFLTHGITSGAQYIVEGEVDNDDNLGISGDSMDAGDKDSEPLREQLSVTGPLSSFYNLPQRSVSHKKEDYQDRFLPIANVARIMKNAIPKTGKIAKDAKECVQECVSEFVSFITSDDRCHQEKRKTINGEDILFAMSTLGFDNYVEPLKLYLQKYREAMKGEKNVSTATAADASLEDLEDGSFSTQTLTASMLSTDQAGQQNVIYTTTYPGQIHFA